MLLVAGVLAGPARAGGETSESDRFFAEMAEAACRDDDFHAFLWPFANSRAVRERHVAPSVFVGSSSDSRAIAAADYLAADDFPILMIDHSYVTAASARLFDAEGGRADQLVYVELEVNTAQDERRRVDWTPGRFEPDEGDGPGTLIEATGPGGHLLFSRSGDCWRLTGDIRER